jgi:hypothetical protein
MANYVRGLGGGCCDNCDQDDPCAYKPIIFVCGSGTATVGVFGSWSGVSSGNNLDGATWSMSAFDGLSINSSGNISGTVPTGPAGTYYITVTATNDCGSTSCQFTLTLQECGDCLLDEEGGSTGTSTTCAEYNYAVTGYFDCARDVYLVYSGFGFFRLRVIADFSDILFSSDCSVDESGSSNNVTIAVPAGTTTLSVTGNCDCDAGGNGSFTFTLDC